MSMEYSIVDCVSFLKEIKKQYNYNCYVFGSGVRQYLKRDIKCSSRYEILVDSDKIDNRIISKYPTMKITFMPLEKFLNSRIAEIDKVVIDSNYEPITKGKSLMSLRGSTLYFNTDIVKKDDKKILELLPYIKDGLCIDEKNTSLLKGKIDINILLDILKTALNKGDSLIGRNILKLFYYTGGVDLLFNNELFTSKNVITFNDLCWVNYSTINTINRTSYMPMRDDFLKFEVACHYMALLICNKKYKDMGRFRDFDEIKCITYLYKNILKLDDSSIENHINEIKYIIETHIKSNRFGLSTYYRDFNNINKVLDENKISVNFYYATLLI